MVLQSMAPPGASVAPVSARVEPAGRSRVTDRMRGAALLLLLLAGAVVALTVDLPSVGSVRGWLAGSGAVGFVALTAGLGLALLAPLPRTAMSVLLGLVAGFWGGVAISLGGAMLGAAGAFGLSRWLGRDATRRLTGSRLSRVHELVGLHGFVSVLGARLTPVVPFTLLSYAVGLTRVRVLPYLAATAIGLVPSTVLQVGIGASAPFFLHLSPGMTVVLGIAVLVLVAAAALVWRRRRRRIRSA